MFCPSSPSSNFPHNYGDMPTRPDDLWEPSLVSSDDSDVFDKSPVETNGTNKKLMRLSVDGRAFQKHATMAFSDSEPTDPAQLNWEFISSSPDAYKHQMMFDKGLRFPRIEEMEHFHYHHIDFNGPLMVYLDKTQEAMKDDDDYNRIFLINVTCRGSSWVVKRTFQDMIDFDRQLHVCIYDRRYSCLPALDMEPSCELNERERWIRLLNYFHRFTMIAGANVNCGPVLNWLELDNHGHHFVVMEADDSAINVPAVAAAKVNKRYVAQAKDELSLEVGDLVSVIDMPPSEETLWWRGKKALEVGFFPSHCVELLGADLHDGQWHFRNRPVINRRGKVVSFLRFFFKARPSKDELMQSGILRERMFGCDLGEYLNKSKLKVPLVLKMCSKIIEEHGIVDGIYRLSGVTSNMQKLRVAFDNDESPNLTDARYLNDIHCISSLLKTYFRELPNPLLTYELYDKFVGAMSKEDVTERTVSFHHVIQRLPPPHYRTLEYLLKHLRSIARRSSETNMNEKNLAIVWAPNLLRPNLEEFGTAALAAIRTQAIIIEYLLKNVEIFFDTNLASSTIAFYPEITDEHLSLKTNHSEVNGSRDSLPHPKLISLKEARERALRKEDIQVVPGSTENILSPRRTNGITNGKDNHHYHERDVAQPTQPATKPVSPGPDLVSLEEARARTRTKSNVLSTRKGSVDLAEIRNKSATVGNRYAPPPNKRRTWKSIFSRKSNDHDSNSEVMGVHDFDTGTTATYRRRNEEDTLSASHPSHDTVWCKRDSEGSVNPLHRTFSSPANSPSGYIRSPFTRQEVFRTSGRDSKRSAKPSISISSDSSSCSPTSPSQASGTPPLTRSMKERVANAERPSSTPGQSRRFDRLAELLKVNGQSHDSSDDEPASPVLNGKPFADETDDGDCIPDIIVCDTREIVDEKIELHTENNDENNVDVETDILENFDSANNELLQDSEDVIKLPDLNELNGKEHGYSPTITATESLERTSSNDSSKNALDWVPIMQKSLTENVTNDDNISCKDIRPFPIESDLHLIETDIIDDYEDEEIRCQRPPSFYENRRPSVYDNID